MHDPTKGALTSIVIPPVSCNIGSEFQYFLSSDWHLGSSCTSYGLINRDLKKTQQFNRRIIINGDLFDGILCKDFKRFSPDVLHHSLHGKKDILGLSVDLAFDILSPYVDLIDVIGVGNHEISIENHHNFDIIRELVSRLNLIRKEGQILLGGVGGFISYRFKDNTKGGRSFRYTIFRHHGGGGAAPVTKGMIDLARLNAWADADLIWIGHKHSKVSNEITRLRQNNKGGGITQIPVKFIVTPSYQNAYQAQLQEDILKNGRIGNYAVDTCQAPQPNGGMILSLTITHDGIENQLLV